MRAIDRAGEPASKQAGKSASLRTDKLTCHLRPRVRLVIGVGGIVRSWPPVLAGGLGADPQLPVPQLTGRIQAG